MKFKFSLNLLKKIFLVAISSVLAITGTVVFYTTEYEKTTAAKATTYYEHDGQNVKIDMYSRVSLQEDDAPTFAVGETIIKAINYKMQNLSDDTVEIKFAVYRYNYDTAVYYKPNTRNYGKMTKLNKDYTDDCERISYSMIRAARYGIKVDFGFHVDNKKTLPYFAKYMNLTCYHDSSKKVSDYLTVKQCTWPYEGGTRQMHSKQLLVSKYLDWDGTVYENAVWSSTSNIDEYVSFKDMPISVKDWSHSGWLISNNRGLYKANDYYFDAAFAHMDNRELFYEEVCELREAGLLDYADNKVEMFFTPRPHIYADAWDVENNPVARVFEKLKHTKTGQIKVYLNLFYFTESVTTKRMVDCIVEAFENNQTEGNELYIVYDDGVAQSSEMYKKVAPYATEIRSFVKTHAKDYAVYFGEADEYLTVTGSVNGSEGENFWKANQQILFKENGDDHTVFDVIKDLCLRTVADKTEIDKMG